MNRDRKQARGDLERQAARQLDGAHRGKASCLLPARAEQLRSLFKDIIAGHPKITRS